MKNIFEKSAAFLFLIMLVWLTGVASVGAKADVGYVKASISGFEY